MRPALIIINSISSDLSQYNKVWLEIEEDKVEIENDVDIWKQ